MNPELIYSQIRLIQKNYLNKEFRDIVVNMLADAKLNDMSTFTIEQALGPAVASLSFAQPYVWTEAMGSLVDEASASFPNTVGIMPDVVPQLYGFYWFDSPLPPRQGGSFNIKAISWHPSMLLHDGEGKNLFMPIPTGVPQPTFDDEDYLALTFWSENYGAIIPISFFQIPLAHPFSDMQESMEVSTGAKIRLVAASYELLAQKILVKHTERLSRAQSRRIKKISNRVIKDIVIIQMRPRITAETKANDTVTREYNNSWVVRGHWRNQWYPAAGLHRALWIRPYVKGPEDKPLRNPKKIFAVVR